MGGPGAARARCKLQGGGSVASSSQSKTPPPFDWGPAADLVFSQTFVGSSTDEASATIDHAVPFELAFPSGSYALVLTSIATDALQLVRYLPAPGDVIPFNIVVDGGRFTLTTESFSTGKFSFWEITVGGRIFAFPLPVVRALVYQFVFGDSTALFALT